MSSGANFFRAAFAGAAALLLLLAAPSVHAQGPAQGRGQGGPGMMMGTPEERAQRELARLTEALELTTAQQAEVRPVLVRQFTAQQAMMEAGRQQGGDMTAMRTGMQALQESTRTAILALLTPAQKTAYQALAEQPGRMRGAPGAGTTPPRGQ